MSLINDALKRAGEVHRARGPKGEKDLPLPPAAVIGGGRAWLKVVAVVMLLVGLLGASAFFFWKWWEERSRAAAQVSVQPKVNSPATNTAPAVPPRPLTNVTAAVTPMPAVAPGAGTTTKTAMVQPVPPPNSNASGLSVPQNPLVAPPRPPVPGTNPPAVAAVVPPPAPVPPEPAPPFKLQGIIMGRLKQSAVINGKTMVTGDRIDGARLARIEPQSVVLEVNGQELKLFLLR